MPTPTPEESVCNRCQKLTKRVAQLEGMLRGSPRLNSRTRTSLDLLERRAVWLEARVAIREEAGKPAGHDLQEIAALRWAILCIQAAARKGMLNESQVPDLEAVAFEDRLQKSGTGL